MASFLMIHGAWHGGWCWTPLGEPLRALGHAMFAPDLPGMGLDSTPLSSITLQSWAHFVAEQARSLDERVFLVGHSRGGAVVSQAAEDAPHLFRGLIYVTALLLPNGGHVLDLAEQMPESAAAAVRQSEDGSCTTLDREAAIELLYNTTPRALAHSAASQLGADPNAPNLAPLKLTAERYGAIPRTYVECTKDQIITLEVQRLMQSHMPCRAVTTLQCDHSPFLSAPQALAAALDQMVQAMAADG